jgi:hypothetical protein
MLFLIYKMLENVWKKPNVLFIDPEKFLVRYSILSNYILL